MPARVSPTSRISPANQFPPTNRIPRAFRPPGLGSAWHLAQVELYHPVLQKAYVFPCDEWLEFTTDKGLDGCKRELLTGAAAAAGGLTSYRVRGCGAGWMQSVRWGVARQ